WPWRHDGDGGTGNDRHRADGHAAVADRPRIPRAAVPDVARRGIDAGQADAAPRIAGSHYRRGRDGLALARTAQADARFSRRPVRRGILIWRNKLPDVRT